MNQELFIELFPIEPSAIPKLTAYIVDMGTVDPAAIAGRLAYRLQGLFPGKWIWADSHIITDSPVDASDMMAAVQHLQQDTPELYGELQIIYEDTNWQASPRIQSLFVLWTYIRELEPQIRSKLSQKTLNIRNGRVERDYVLRNWVVNATPAISVSIRSRLLSANNLQEHITNIDDPSEIAGLLVQDRTATTMVGEVVEVTGTLGEYREDLLQLTERAEMQQILRNAPDDEKIVLIRSGRYEYEYVASALQIIVSSSDSEQLQKYGMVPKQVARVFRLSPDARSELVRLVSGELKNEGLIGNSFNTRTSSELFDLVQFVPDLEFGDHRPHPYNSESLRFDFQRGGVYKRHSRYEIETNPIKIAIVNTLDEKVDDFIEVLARQLQGTYGIPLDVLRERRVRVLSRQNLESAVRVVEKEDPDVILAFFPDFDEITADEEEATYAYLKSLTLAKGIPAYPISYANIHKPEAMPNIVMGILARTGNIPYVLAESLDYVDYVVGLDIVREKLKSGDRVTLMTRVYRNNGEFLGYVFQRIELEANEPIPLIVMQELLPPDDFEQKHILIHKNGRFARDELTMLEKWQKVLKGQLYPVEILQWNVPRLYGLEQRRVVQPPHGSMFRINHREAFIVTSTPPRDSTPIPLHIRVLSGEVAIDQAIHSVLGWTLFHYGRLTIPKLPVTVEFADEIADWLVKGGFPEVIQDEIPFWL